MDSTLSAVAKDIPNQLRLLAPPALIGLAGYGYVLTNLCKNKGRVNARTFEMPDLLVAIVLLGFFGMMTVANWPNPQTPAPAFNVNQLIPSSMVMLGIAAGAGGFLAYRGADVGGMFGLSRTSPLRTIGFAVLFLVAAFPVMEVVSLTGIYFLGGSAEEQPLITLFRTEAEHGHHSAVIKMLIVGAVLAPITEEFLFRAFFYGIFKRYMGAIGAAVTSAAIFGAFHMNLASLAPLFVFALCLTLAYERTGSLLTPICMHALFNSSTLLLLYVQARSVPA